MVGLAAEPSYSLQRLATASLRALALETGDWVFFSVVQGLEVICLSRETGHGPIPSDALRLGDRHPLGVGAGGLAILAALPDDEVDNALQVNGRHIDENYPKSPVAVIRHMVAETRERGYAVIPGIVVPGYWALGVPLLQRDGRPVGAIVLVASESRLHPTRRNALGDRMIGISRDLMSRAEQGEGNRQGTARRQAGREPGVVQAASVLSPSQVSSSEPNRCSEATPSASTKRPCCSSVTTSMEKVEKVVSAPSRPVTMARRQAGSRCGLACSTAKARPMA